MVIQIGLRCWQQQLPMESAADVCAHDTLLTLQELRTTAPMFGSCNAIGEQVRYPRLGSPRSDIFGYDVLICAHDVEGQVCSCGLCV